MPGALREAAGGGLGGCSRLGRSVWKKGEGRTCDFLNHRGDGASKRNLCSMRLVLFFLLRIFSAYWSG